jgi:hypothetical protein
MKPYLRQVSIETNTQEVGTKLTGLRCIKFIADEHASQQNQQISPFLVSDVLSFMTLFKETLIVPN